MMPFRTWIMRLFRAQQRRRLKRHGYEEADEVIGILRKAVDLAHAWFERIYPDGQMVNWFGDYEHPEKEQILKVRQALRDAAALYEELEDPADVHP